MEERVLKAQAGDCREAEWVLKRFEPLVRAQARRMGWADREEALQEGRLAVWQAVCDFDPDIGSPFAAFVKVRVWSALRNLCRREWRRGNRILSARPEEGEEAFWERLPSPEEDWDEALWLEELLASLTPRERTWVRGQILQGYTLHELAEREGVSLETVKTWKKRAVAKLKQVLSPPSRGSVHL